MAGSDYRRHTDALLELRGDVVHALRQMRRAPALAAVVAGTIALGIGASLAIFMLIDRVVVQPLDVRDASRLVVLQRLSQLEALGLDTWSNDAWHTDQHRQTASASTITTAASVQSQPLLVDLGRGGTGEPRSALFVSGGYLDVLGIVPALGREFLPADDRDGAPIAILSHHLWQARFAGDTAILGHVIRVNGSPVEVVGVAPRTFRGTTLGARAPDLLLPLGSRAHVVPDDIRSGVRMRMVGRLAPDATMTQAGAEVAALLEMEDATRVRARPVRDAFVPPSVQADLWWFLSMVAAAVGLTVVIACANLTSLLQARVHLRRAEFALRSALGATRGRLARQLAVETAVLAAVGGLGALAVAQWIVQGFSAFVLPGGIALSTLGDADTGRTVIVAAVLTVVVAVVVSVGPMLRATRHGLAQDVRHVRDGAGRGATHVLLGLQVVICVVLVFGAGLFVRSLSAALSADTGFDQRGLVSASIAMPTPVTPALAQQGLQIDALVTRVGERPDVVSVAVGPMPLAQGSNLSTSDIRRDGDPVDLAAPLEVAFPSAGYFTTLQQPMVTGRDFTADDVARGDAVAIVNESAARALWGGDDPLGRQIGYTPFPNTEVEVIGVVRDAMVKGIGDRRPVLYVLRSSRSGADLFTSAAAGALFLTVRTRDDPAALADPLYRTAADLGLSITNVTTLEAAVADLVMPQRLGRALLAGLGVVALAVTLVGIYGSVSGAVTRRRRDAGVLMALGATPIQVAGATLRPILAVVGIGLGLGGVAAWASGRAVARFLYGIDAADPATLAFALLLLGATAAVAAAVPAARILRLDPAQVLRPE